MLFNRLSTPFRSDTPHPVSRQPDPKLAAKSDPADWLIESFVIAQNDVYGTTIGDGEGPFTLCQTYKDRSLLVAKDRAALAATRLAALINADLK